MLTEAGKNIAQALANISEVQQAAQPPAVATTKNHYGYYASVIGQLAQVTGREGKEGHVLAAEALTLAGGNAEGIADAMYAMFGYAEYDPFNRMFSR